jgi:hypothetical protein
MEEKMNRKTVIFFMLIFSGISLLSAASLDETLESLSGTAAKAYVTPIVSGFGTNINGGWFHKSPKSSFLGLNFEIGLVAMATMFGDEDEHFSTEGNFRFNYSQALQLTENVDENVRDYVIEAILMQEFVIGMFGPTIIGPDDEYINLVFYEKEIEFTDDLGNSDSVIVPGKTIETEIYGILNGLPALPMFAPQISIGTVFGTQFTARFLPPYEIEDLGEVSYYGAGLQHNIKSWLPLPLPVDVSLSGFYQTLNLGDYVSAGGFAAGFNVSKTFGPRMLSVTPYAGFMLESSKMEFAYDYDVSPDIDPLKIKFQIEGENKSRLIIGSSFRVGVLHLNADYNIGNYNSATLGFAFAF